MLGIEPSRTPHRLPGRSPRSRATGSATPTWRGHRLAGALELLDELRCDGFEEPCWGYHFPFQSRVFVYGAASRTRSPQLRRSCAARRIRAHGDPALLERARGGGRFFLRHVPLTGRRGGVLRLRPGTARRCTTRACTAAALLARLAARGRDAEALGRRRPRGALDPLASARTGRGPTASGRTGLDRRVPHGLRARRAARVRRRRNRGRGCRGRVDEGDRVLPERAVRGRRNSQILLEQASPDRRAVRRAGDPDAVDRRAPSRLAGGALVGVSVRASPDVGGDGMPLFQRGVCRRTEPRTSAGWSPRRCSP